MIRKLFVLVASATIATGGASAAVLPSCSLFAGYTLTNLLSQSCVVGDKIFLNFTSNSLKSVTDQVSFAPLAAVNNDPGVAFNGLSAPAGQSVAFNVGYTVQVLPKSSFLIQAGDLSISNIAFGTGGSLAGFQKYCVSGAGNAETCVAEGGQLYSATVSASAPSAAFWSDTAVPLPATLDVSTDLTVTAGASRTPVGSIQERFAQVAVPEPSTLFLMGSGLMAISKVSRRRVRRKR